MPEVSVQEWEEFYNHHPHAHMLQSPYWGELKTDATWEAVRVIKEGNGAQMLFRKLPMGYTLAFIPKGPLGDDWRKLRHDIDQACKARNAFVLRIEPNLWEDENIDLRDQGFIETPLNLHAPRTILIDISKDEEEIMAAMKQKTRYYIRLAMRRGVTVSISSDLETFHKLMVEMGERNNIGVQSLDYFHNAYQMFHDAGQGELLIAEYGGIPLSTVFLSIHGKRAWPIYGASSNQHRNLGATHLLEWESIRWAKQQGCSEYDMWGVPDHDEDFLEAHFTERRDGLWGVYGYKRGFGGQVVRNAEGWDRIYKPIPYQLYKQAISMQSVKSLLYRIRRKLWYRG